MCYTDPADGVIVSGTDECDDGNRLSGDGCSSTGMVEWGWECFINPNDLYDEPYLCVKVDDIHEWDWFVAIICGYLIYFFILASMIFTLFTTG